MRKNKAAVALGRLGGLKGGPARMKSMTAAERSALGRKAARQRWAATRRGDDSKEFARRVASEQARLQPLLPDIDAHDLNLIIANMLRPPWKRKFFLRKKDDHYVF